MSYLLDTCYLSELIKPRPNPGTMAWLGAQHSHDVYLSVITVGEVEAGISRMPDGPKREKLAAWLETGLIRRFSARLLDVDVEVATVWGRVRGSAAAKGVVLPFGDSLIAATALAHKLTVVTRNEADFRRCGVPTLNPWS